MDGLFGLGVVSVNSEKADLTILQGSVSIWFKLVSPHFDYGGIWCEKIRADTVFWQIRKGNKADIRLADGDYISAANSLLLLSIFSTTRLQLAIWTFRTLHLVRKTRARRIWSPTDP